MFAYIEGELRADSVSLYDIDTAVGTPFYCYSVSLLRQYAQIFCDIYLPRGIQPYFAVKANSNQAVLKLFASYGFGADIVSHGELQRALAAGIPGKLIVFSGVGKTRAEIESALDAGIHAFNIESESELVLLGKIAGERSIHPLANLRINPDVEAGGHHKIKTGRAEDKFGITLNEVDGLFELAAGLPVALTGLAVHIGSQIVELEPYRIAYNKIAELLRSLTSRGYRIDRLDLGGGFGIRYRDEQPFPFDEHAVLISDLFGDFDVDIGIEPGRALVGNAGILVSRVIHFKESGGRTFIICDAAMNDLIRPSLYEAWHDIIPVRQPAEINPVELCDIVGPVCESGDTFAVDRSLVPIGAGELLEILSVGAYGATMSSTYNTRPLIPEVMVDGEKFAVIRRRVSAEEQIALDSIPPWLTA